MAAQWYYTTNKQQMGPVSWDELRQLAAAGLLKPGDLVWCDGMGEWLKAERQSGLFPERQAVTVARHEVVEAAPSRSSETRRRIDRDFDEDEREERSARRRARRKGAGLKIGIIVGVSVLVLLVLGCGVIGILLAVFGNPFGGFGAGGDYSLNLAPGTHNERVFRFRAGQRVRVTVTTNRNLGAFQPDVDLFVMRGGNIVANDIRIHPDCDVTFVAPANDSYTIRVQNLGPGRASSRVAVH